MFYALCALVVGVIKSKPPPARPLPLRPCLGTLCVLSMSTALAVGPCPFEQSTCWKPHIESLCKDIFKKCLCTGLYTYTHQMAIRARGWLGSCRVLRSYDLLDRFDEHTFFVSPILWSYVFHVTDLMVFFPAEKLDIAKFPQGGAGTLQYCAAIFFKNSCLERFKCVFDCCWALILYSLCLKLRASGWLAVALCDSSCAISGFSNVIKTNSIKSTIRLCRVSQIQTWKMKSSNVFAKQANREISN